jgi:hypothetical protein
MAKGYDFEQEVENYLLSGFTTQKNYPALSETSGKRREVDIVATINIPPFGDVHFLVECKTQKLSVTFVKDFKDKLEDMKRGCDPYSSGVPIMISPEGWSAPALDEANKCGIALMTFAQLQSANIPIPREIDITIQRIQQSNELGIREGMNVPTADWGNLKITKSNTDHDIKGLGNFDLYAEYEQGVIKKTVLAFGKFVMRLDEDLLRLWIQRIDAHVETKIAKGFKIANVVIGFFTKAISDDDKKTISRVKNSTKSEVCVIDANFKMLGNLNAKKIFTP